MATTAHAQSIASNGPVKTLGTVTVTSGRPSSLPSEIPTTMEGVDKKQIEQTINATDSEDALKYLPSLLVRKRYIGDYNHAVLSSRASGTGNSARSAVYADGILLSNYLGNGATYTPRWGMVTPEEIERVDVMYGPFSAAYPGNSVGAIVDYVTRMPTKFEGHAKVSTFSQTFKMYNTNETYQGKQASVSLGSKSGDWSYWFNVNHTDSEGQPLTFVTKPLSSSAPAGTVVSGAVPEKSTTNANILVLGTGTQYHTIQDHAKTKIAYDFSSTIRATYTLGLWQNTSEGRSKSYLKDASGREIYSGTVNINGRAYTLNPTDFGATNEKLLHFMHGLSVKSNTKGVFDWEVAASLYDYNEDKLRRPTGALPNALGGGAGTIQDQSGTGWSALALKGIWRPQGIGGAHILDFGYQQENYKLKILTSNTSDWITGSAGAASTDVGGKTQLQSLYVQDTWRFAKNWKTVLGARFEDWQASNGYTFNATSNPTQVNYQGRHESFVSPKAALAYQFSSDTVLKASLGRAVRMPTVSELYGATSNATLSFINDPNLKPEKSWTSELTAEKDLGNGFVRATYFYETVKDSLYSQLIPGSTTVSRVQNVDGINTSGFELAYQGNDVVIRGLDFSSSVTYADSKIVKNDAFPESVGKWQPRVPRWRATALFNYHFNDRLNVAYGIRYSGKQYSQLNNSDVNGFSYTGASKYYTTDLRIRYKVNKQWSAAVGVDNLNNYQYWNFHPYPSRTYVAEVKFDF